MCCWWRWWWWWGENTKNVVVVAGGGSECKRIHIGVGGLGKTIECVPDGGGAGKTI